MQNDDANRIPLVPTDPDLSRLPVEFHTGPTPLFGLTLMLAGVLGPLIVGGTLGLVGLLGDMPEGYGRIVLLMAAIPLLALPWGWWVIRSRTIVRIGADNVTRTKITPLRQSRAETPLADYDAVAYRLLLPSSNAKAGTNHHGVELCNNAGGDDLLLVSASDEALAREVQTALSRLTGLKAQDRKPRRR